MGPNNSARLLEKSLDRRIFTMRFSIFFVTTVFMGLLVTKSCAEDVKIVYTISLRGLHDPQVLIYPKVKAQVAEPNPCTTQSFPYERNLNLAPDTPADGCSVLYSSSQMDTTLDIEILSVGQNENNTASAGKAVIHVKNLIDGGPFIGEIWKDTTQNSLHMGTLLVQVESTTPASRFEII